MFLFLLANLVSSGFCYETLDSESSALSSALLAKEEEESNIFFPFAYNCEWKAHIFFVHRSMHWKAVHLWTQVHQTETFFIILFFQSSRRNCLHPCYCCLVWLASKYIYFCMKSMLWFLSSASIQKREQYMQKNGCRSYLLIRLGIA